MRDLWMERQEKLSEVVRAQPLLALGTALLAGYLLARLGARYVWGA